MNGQPILKFLSMEHVRLLQFAASRWHLADGKAENTFLSDQLDSWGVRLTWSPDERIMEVLLHFLSTPSKRDTIDCGPEGHW